MIKKLVRPDVMENVRNLVDEQINEELACLRILVKEGTKKKKKIAKKSKRVGKKKIGKKKPLPGEKKTFHNAPRSTKDLFAELVEKGIVRKKLPATMDDFIGDFD